ncbi:hypothetical protein ACEWY4_000232 [Coilia grayii]|uniref:Ig-like domain-containing protein n=1 Tax=Coilia grayii TaxID=363190 RepID=A0ABD1KW22_9TELE
MATFSDVTVLLTLVISSVHSYPGTAIFALKGEKATFRVLSVEEDSSTLLYKMTENGPILLKNLSDPTQSSDSERSARVSVFFKPWTLPYFVLRNLSLSDSGQYRTDVCKRGMCHPVTIHNLTVCAEKMKVRREEVDGTIQWTVNGVNQSRGDILQMYQDTHTTCEKSEIQVVLDTQLSLEIIPEDMKEKVEVLTNGSSVRISHMSSHEDQAIYHILLWKGDQCQLHSETKGDFFHAYNTVTAKEALPMKGDRLSLICHPNISGPAHWFRDESSVEIQSRQTFNMTPQQDDTDMYVDMRNYSLIFPSVTPEHDGLYCCYPEGHPQDMTGHYVFAHSELNSTYLTFSTSDMAVLRCHADTNGFWVKKWFRQRGLELEELVVYIAGPKMIYIHEDLRGRVNVSLRNASLIISALTPEDSGVYRCRGWKYYRSRQKNLFFQQRFHLIYKDPFGVDSMFYRVYVSLMGFGLLVMICAVMSVKWRFRGGGQVPPRSLRSTADTPGHLSREGEQRGEQDEDVDTDGHSV